ncbi:DUF7210 family protein [Gorillibacterium sp. sgz500922]|uniref:DUF7210 family protein n=1 Tax=Gorillibacterium sp. sgz500922 TaxID=3446694 RepID=UPI003F66F45A
MKVQVNEIPIEHDGTLYEKGASFSLTADQYDRLKDHVTVLDEADETPAADKAVDDMTVAELKAYAKAQGIDLGDATKKEEILAAVKAASQ